MNTITITFDELNVGHYINRVLYVNNQDNRFQHELQNMSNMQQPCCLLLKQWASRRLSTDMYRMFMNASYFVHKPVSCSTITFDIDGLLITFRNIVDNPQSC